MSYIQSYLQPLAQRDFLQRMFYEALVPQVMFLACAPDEELAPGNGDTIIRTVPGVRAPRLTPLVPGKDPIPTGNSYEHFVTSIAQYSDTDDVPTNQAAVTIEGVRGFFMQKMGELAIGCGTTLNLLARNAIYGAYTQGNAVAYAANGNTTTLYLNNLNGFWSIVKNGQPTTISVQNPKAITINGVARSATGYAPLDAEEPNGPGTLTISAAIDCPAGAEILAVDRSRIMRPQNATFDQLQPNDSATLRIFQNAAARLENDGVRPMSDGKYHVHLAPMVETELGNDNAYARMFEGLPSGYMPDGSIGTIGNLRFFKNNQTPQPGVRNSGVPIAVPTRGTLLARGYFGELYNAIGTQVQRSVVLGEKAVSTLFIDESKTMLAEAGQPVGGPKSFAMVGNQLQMMAGAGAMGNVRITIRPPIDRAGQMVAITWTTTRGYPVYVNLLSGQSDGRCKRAVVVETGTPQD
jgi:hypothetical protein